MKYPRTLFELSIIINILALSLVPLISALTISDGKSTNLSIPTRGENSSLGFDLLRRAGPGKGKDDTKDNDLPERPRTRRSTQVPDLNEGQQPSVVSPQQRPRSGTLPDQGLNVVGAESAPSSSPSGQRQRLTTPPADTASSSRAQSPGEAGRGLNPQHPILPDLARQRRKEGYTKRSLEPSQQSDGNVGPAAASVLGHANDQGLSPINNKPLPPRLNPGRAQVRRLHGTQPPVTEPGPGSGTEQPGAEVAQVRTRPDLAWKSSHTTTAKSDLSHRKRSVELESRVIDETQTVLQTRAPPKASKGGNGGSGGEKSSKKSAAGGSSARDSNSTPPSAEGRQSSPSPPQQRRRLDTNPSAAGGPSSAALGGLGRVGGAQGMAHGPAGAMFPPSVPSSDKLNQLIMRNRSPGANAAQESQQPPGRQSQRLQQKRQRQQQASSPSPSPSQGQRPVQQSPTRSRSVTATPSPPPRTGRPIVPGAPKRDRSEFGRYRPEPPPQPRDQPGQKGASGYDLLGAGVGGKHGGLGGLHGFGSGIHGAGGMLGAAGGIRGTGGLFGAGGMFGTAAGSAGFGSGAIAMAAARGSARRSGETGGASGRIPAGGSGGTGRGGGATGAGAGGAGGGRGFGRVPSWGRSFASIANEGGYANQPAARPAAGRPGGAAPGRAGAPGLPPAGAGAAAAAPQHPWGQQFANVPQAAPPGLGFGFGAGMGAGPRFGQGGPGGGPGAGLGGLGGAGGAGGADSDTNSSRSSTGSAR